MRSGRGDGPLVIVPASRGGGSGCRPARRGAGARAAACVTLFARRRPASGHARARGAGFDELRSSSSTRCSTGRGTRVARSCAACRSAAWSRCGTPPPRPTRVTRAGAGVGAGARLARRTGAQALLRRARRGCSLPVVRRRRPRAALRPRSWRRSPRGRATRDVRGPARACWSRRAVSPSLMARARSGSLAAVDFRDDAAARRPRRRWSSPANRRSTTWCRWAARASTSR